MRSVGLSSPYPIRWRPCADPGQKRVPGERTTQKGMDQSRLDTEAKSQRRDDGSGQTVTPPRGITTTPHEIGRPILSVPHQVAALRRPRTEASTRRKDNAKRDGPIEARYRSEVPTPGRWIRSDRNSAPWHHHHAP